MRSAMLRQEKLNRTKYYFDRRAHSLRPLPIGTTVRLQHPQSKRWSEVGIITDKVGPRSYMIKRPDHSVLQRTRQHLRPVLPQMDSAASGLPQIDTTSSVGLPHHIAPDSKLTRPSNSRTAVKPTFQTTRKFLRDRPSLQRPSRFQD